MSEETKLAYIQERLREAKRHQRYGTFLIILSFIIIMFAAMEIWFNRGFNIWVFLVGCGVFAWGLSKNVRNDLKHRELLNQLGKKAFATTCPKCGKDIPNVNFAFCPFCGVELERK